LENNYMLNVDEKTLEDALSGFFIPAKPDVLTELQSVLDDEESSIDDMALIIVKDVSLSSAILKTINSSFFGLSRKISDIRQAVCFLGKITVTSIVTALLFRRSFEGSYCCISLERFWDDATDIANAMTFIEKGISYKLPEENLYAIGLFHDSGIPVLANKFVDYKEILIKANGDRCNSIAMEEAEYRTNHAVVGYFIAVSWNLPKDVCNVILHHHEFNFLNKKIGSNEQLGYATLKLAENLVHRNKRFCESPDWRHVKNDVLDILGIEDSELHELEDKYNATIEHP
jgi:HD-like signal output (HDOD) protein